MKSEEQVSGRAGAAVGAAAPRRPAPLDVQHAPEDSAPPARAESSSAAATQTIHTTAPPRRLDDGRRARPEPMTHERRVLLMALAAGAPAVLVSLALLWAGGYTPKVVWTLGALVVCFWLGFSFAVQGRVVRPLQTVSNL